MSPRVTYDVDLCYERDPANLERRAGALTQLDATLRGVPPGLPFRPDGRTLGMGSNFTFETSLGPLDLLGYVEPTGDFRAVAAGAETYTLVDGRPVRTIALDDLTRVKTTIKRFKDGELMFQLLAIKQARDRTGLR